MSDRVNLPHLPHLLHQMIRIRQFEEKAAELYSSGKFRGFLHLYIGEEAIAAGVMPSLNADDAVVSTYREHGHALARGVSMNSIMAEMYGKVEGCSHGRGGSMHLFDISRKFYGGNAIVAGGLPLAVGMALAMKLRPSSQMGPSTSLAACLFGDGAVAEGAFHESLNLAALWRLPVLFLCENNFYAMGTALHRHQAETDLALKAKGYRIAAHKIDGMDVDAVEKATREAVCKIREGQGPQFLELQTYRFRPHSMFDPDLYRDKSEIEKWRAHDPIVSYSTILKKQGVLDDAQIEHLEAKVREEVQGAVAFAESGTFEPVEMLTRDVYTLEASK